MATTERRTGCTRRGMILLGRIPSAPKPINLPSQRLENQGQGQDVDIVPRGTFSWGNAPRKPPAVHNNQENKSNGGPQSNNPIANKAADSAPEKATSHMQLSSGTSSGSDVSPPSSAGSSRSSGMSSISSHSTGSDNWNDYAKVHPNPNLSDDSTDVGATFAKSCPATPNTEDNSSSVLDTSVKLKELGNSCEGDSNPSNESLNGPKDVKSQQNEKGTSGSQNAQCHESDYCNNGCSEYPPFTQHNGPGMPYGPGMYPPHNGPYNYPGAPYYGGSKEREIVVIHMYSNPGYYGNYLSHPGFQEQYGRPGVYGHFPLQFGQFEPFLMPGQIIMDGAPHPPTDMNSPFFSEQQHYVSYECERRSAEWVQGCPPDNTSLVDNRDAQMKRTFSAFEPRSQLYRENALKKVGKRKPANRTGRKPSVAVALQERRVTLLTKASRHEVIINSCYHDDGQDALGSYDSSSLTVIDNIPNSDCLCDSTTSCLETAMVESVRSPTGTRISGHGESPEESMASESSSDKLLANATVADLQHGFSPAVDQKLSGETSVLSPANVDENIVNTIKHEENNHAVGTTMSSENPVKPEVISTGKVNQSFSTTNYKNTTNLKYKPRNMGFNQQKKVFVFKVKKNMSDNNMLKSSSVQGVSIASGVAPKISSEDARDGPSDLLFQVRPVQKVSTFVQRDTTKESTALAESKDHPKETSNINKKEWRAKPSNALKVNLQVKVQSEPIFQNRYRKKKTLSQLSQPADLSTHVNEGKILTSDVHDRQQNEDKCRINQVGTASKNCVAESQVQSLSVSAKEPMSLSVSESQVQSLAIKSVQNYQLDLPSQIVLSNHFVDSSIDGLSHKGKNAQHKPSWADKCTQELHQKPHINVQDNELVPSNKLKNQTGKLHYKLKGSLTSQGSFYVSGNQKTVLVKYQMTGRRLTSSHSENALKVKNSEDSYGMQNVDKVINQGESNSTTSLAQGEVSRSNSKILKHMLWKEKKTIVSENSNFPVEVEKTIQVANVQSSEPEIHANSTSSHNGNVHPVLKHSYKAVLQMQWPAVAAPLKKIEACTSGKQEMVGKKDQASEIVNMGKSESTNVEKQQTVGKEDNGSTKSGSRNGAKTSQPSTTWRPKTPLNKDVKESNGLTLKSAEGHTKKSPVPLAESSSKHVSKAVPHQDHKKYSHLQMPTKFKVVTHEKKNEGFAREIANVPPNKVKGDTTIFVKKQVVSVSSNPNVVHCTPFSSKSNFPYGENDRIYKKTLPQGTYGDKMSSGWYNSKVPRSGQFKRGWVIKTESGC